MSSKLLSNSANFSEWASNLPLSSSEKVHICNIIDENKLVIDDLQDFSNAVEMSSELGMNEEICIKFWDYVTQYKESGDERKSNEMELDDMNESQNEGRSKYENWKEEECEMKNEGKYESNNVSSNTDNNDSKMNENENESDNDSNGSNDNRSKKSGNHDRNISKKMASTTIGGTMGFTNLTNTCFLNSAMQILLHCPGLTDELITKAETLMNEFENEKRKGKKKCEENESQRLQEWQEVESGDNEDNKNENWRYNLSKNDFVYFTDYYGQKHKSKVTMTLSQESGNEIKLIYNWRGMRYQIGPINRSDTRLTCCENNQTKLNGRNKNNKNLNLNINSNSNSNLSKNKHKNKTNNNSGSGWMSYFGYGNNNVNNNNNNNYNNNHNGYHNKNGNVNGKHGGNNFGIVPFGSAKEYEFENTMYGQWLNIVNLAHLKQRNSIAPRALHNLVRKRLPELGDYAQHDSCQALMGLLKEIENDLTKMKSNKNNSNVMTYDYDVDESIFDKPYNKENDRIIVETLQSDGMLTTESTIISKYFDGIEVTQNTCMDCGKQSRLFSIGRLIELPIVKSYCLLTIYGYNELKKVYFPIINRECVPLDCNVKLAKFYALKSNKKYICNELDNYNLVLISKTLEFKHCRVLNDDDCLEKFGGYNDCALFLLPNIEVGKQDTFSFSSKINDNTYNNNNISSSKSVSNGGKSIVKMLCIHSGDRNMKEKFDCLVFDKKLVQRGISARFLLNALENLWTTKSKNSKYELTLFINDEFISNASVDSRQTITLNDNNNNNNSNNNIMIAYWINKETKDVTMNMAMNSSDDYNVRRNNKSKVYNGDYDSKIDLNNVFDAFKRELQLCTMGLSLKMKIKFVENRRTMLNNGLDNMKNINNKSMTSDEVEMTNEFNLHFEANNDFRFEINLLKQQVGICNDFINFYEKIIKRKSSIMENGQNKMELLFNECKINCGSSIIVKRDKELTNIVECFKSYEAESFRTYSQYPTPCDNCGNAPILGMSRETVSPPKILIVKFDRGLEDSNKKLRHTVFFEMELDFHGSKYQLFAINVHSGSSGFGHYTSYVKQLNTNKWLYCNDSSVRSGYRELPCANAQFLVYQRQD